MLFQISGITILLIFYGCYFLKMEFQRKKGIQTNQIGKGKVGTVKIIENMMKVVTILVPIIEVVSIYLHTTKFPISVRILGICIGFIGVTVFVISVLTMRDSWRAGVSETDETELVTSGIYQISRNPAFLGFDLVYIGIALMFFNWGLLFVSVFAMVMFHLQIVNVEEKFLTKAFGSEYVDYQKRVNRYLGSKIKVRTMNCIIREIRESEYSSLPEFLYEAIFIPKGMDKPAKSIILQPELQVYVADFGKPDDWCLVAETKDKVVGAAWVRIMNDYGHVDDETPSLAISLYEQYRHLGIGTKLMRKMLKLLKEKGYKQVSLSVQKANYAVNMYRKLGFEVVEEKEEEYIMICSLK